MCRVTTGRKVILVAEMSFFSDVSECLFRLHHSFAEMIKQIDPGLFVKTSRLFLMCPALSCLELIRIPDMFRVSCLALANKAEISQKS